MKDRPWFKFYPAAWMMGDISLASIAAQGAFIRLVALAWGQDGRLEMTPSAFRKIGIRQDSPEWTELVELECVKLDGTAAIVEFLNEQHQEVSATREQNSRNAKKRYDRIRPNASACERMRAHTTACNKKEKENENKKENINAGAGAPAKPAALPESVGGEENERLLQAWIDLREQAGDKITQSRRDMLVLRLTRLKTREKVKTSLENALARNSRDFYDPTPPARQDSNLPTGQIHKSAMPADFKFRRPGDDK